ncbi:alpha/beta fold hydrolase [Maricaulis sp. CAU 1757]
MRSVLRAAAVVLALGVVALTGVVVWAWAPDIERNVLVERYSNAASRFVELPSGIEVHLRDEGCADCPPVVLVHGSNASLHTWEPWVELLQSDWRLISIDMPAHGLTGPTADADYSIGRAAGVVEEVRAHLALDRIHIAGNSRGGAIALYYAVEHPDRVASLGLLNAAGAPWPQDDDEDGSPLVYALADNPLLAPLLQNLLPASLIEGAVSSAFVDKTLVTDDMVRRYQDLLRYPGTRSATLMRQDLEYPLEPYYQAHTLDMPVMVMWGDQDTIVPVGQMARFLEVMPHARPVLYEGVGHVPMEEIPARSAADYAAFLVDAERARDG